MPTVSVKVKHIQVVWKHRRDPKRARCYLYYRNVPPGENLIRLHYVTGEQQVYVDSYEHPEFMRAYQHTEYLAQLLWKRPKDPATGETQWPAKSIGALIEKYKGSPDYKQKKPKTKASYTPHLDFMVKTWGHLQAVNLPTELVLEHRDFLADKPRTADGWVQVVSIVMNFGIQRGFTKINPAARIKRIAKASPYEPWEWSEIEAFVEGAPAHVVLAFLGLLYTGQRESDLVNMTRENLKGGEIRVIQEKTGKPLWIPIHSRLKAAIEAYKTKVKNVRWLFVNSYGQQWTVDGLRTALYDARVGLELKHRQPHGLRKNGVVSLFEVGCTTAQVSSITGQSLQVVEHYWKKWNQKTLAKQAIALWEGNES